jgi:glycosyltransferase involved in cell wall biosynthesis
MNVGFCRWVRRRGLKGDTVELMAHEAYLGFREGSWRHDVAATVHRLMVSLLLSVSRRVWVSIPAWVSRMRPYAFGRRIEFCWLPVPSTVPVVNDPWGVREARARYATAQGPLVGHFGTYGLDSRRDLEPLIASVLRDPRRVSNVLIGPRERRIPAGDPLATPRDRRRVHAAGTLSLEALSVSLQACDVLVQPYVDGASSRRTTLMAALAHGVPVVTTEGRLSEAIWRETNAVRLVPPRDSDAAARAVVALCSDTAEQARLTAAARALYADRFDLSHTIHALIAESCRAA